MGSQRGFTQIEVLVVLAVSTAIAATALPAMTSLGATLRLAASVRTLTETLRETRARALADGDALDALFDPTTGTWRVQTATGALRRQETLPAPLRFTALPATSRIRFSATGTAENGTIVVGSGALSRRIIVNQRGRVRLG
jgi:prepilin-type N-terminal cleavage/methylation domain-containing protein